MPQLPSTRFYINSEETDLNSPASEATFQKIGQAINFINDLFQQVNQYTSGGSFTVPTGIQRVWVLGYGGGGGGSTFAGSVGGGGGSGCVPQLMAIPTTPGDTYTITIGAGGAPASDGGDTSFINSVSGKGLTFYGAAGAKAGVTTYTNGTATQRGFDESTYPLASLIDPDSFYNSGFLWNGGLGMRKIDYISSFPSIAFNVKAGLNYFAYTIGGRGDTNDSGNNVKGQSSIYATGGAITYGGDRGGSGGAGFGDGGSATNAATGGSAAANSGAGGGGAITTGGSGGSGGLFVLF